jgi:hypothetical protein
MLPPVPPAAWNGAIIAQNAERNNRSTSNSVIAF